MSARWLLALALAGCLGTTPDDRRRDQIGEGEEDDDEGPEHNPGEPCLLCHSGTFPPGDASFAFAGTIYLEQGDTAGVEGALVRVTDAQGRIIDATTNRTGNFMIEVSGRGEGDRGRGRTRVGFEPEFPLRVTLVAYEGLEQEMVTSVLREGSCSECHYREPSTSSVGRVFLVDPP